MPFTLLSQANLDFNSVRLVATDMDGTLTSNEKFTPALLQALAALAKAGIAVVIVTGRSAGWVSGLAHYLPVAGAIAENGGIFFSTTVDFELLVPISDFTMHRQQLAQIFRELQAEFPQIRESTDNRYRLTDWTFDVAGLSPAEIETMSDRCQQSGWGFTYSTVQCHIKLAQQEKATGLLQVLAKNYPELNQNQVLTVGDSPNDESLFDGAKFPLSVGVANVWQYRDRLAHQPAYLTATPEGDGFCELSRCLLRKCLGTQIKQDPETGSE